MAAHFLWGNLRLIQTPECKQAQGLSPLPNLIFVTRNMRPVRNNSLGGGGGGGGKKVVLFLQLTISYSDNDMNK